MSADGRRFTGRVFIDATYEGDLLAAAGVSSTLDREANAQYGEIVNGIQAPAKKPVAGRFTVPVDPYRTPGDAASGTLPHLLQAEKQRLGPAALPDRLRGHRAETVGVRQSARHVRPLG